MAHLPALHVLMGAPAAAASSPDTAEIVSYLRASGTTLTYDPRTRTLRPDVPQVMPATIAQVR